MSFRNLSLAVLAIAALSACSSNKDDANRLAAAPALEEGAGNVGSYNAGVPNYTFTVEHGSILVDGAAVDSIDNAMFDGYPSLAKHTAAVGSVTKAIETKENALELYAGDDLLMAWDLRGDAPTLAYSRDGFSADSVRYTKTAGSEQDQSLATGEVTFNFNECKVEQEQEQEQEQGKVEEKGKVQGLVGSEQEQGKVEEKGQEQEQGKVEEKGQEQAPKEQEQGKVEEKAKEVCKTVEMKLNLREIEVEKKQEQVEEKGQEQEQGKVEEKGQEQEQGKVEEKGQEQAPKEQEQGKVEEKGQEQAPKEQEQGKVEEKGQEQAPKEQEQGKSQEQAQKR